MKETKINTKVLDLANKFSLTKRGAKNEILPEHPEYKVLEPIISDEMADVALCLKFREPQTAAEIAPQCGKSIEETRQILHKLAKAGASVIGRSEGVDKFWHEIWIPGHMEAIVNNRENVAKYPQIGKAFDDYGRRKAPLAAGNFPMGTGFMRVIPIEQSIEGETRRASYEEVSKYLNEAETFSVSDCSCRTSREALGEGCGHLKEDMCIQLGFAAEYYIRTGRGREISREEAFDIIHRAEENGLMHSIPNVDGPGHTHAICNCCGCSCYSLRNANMWGNYDFVRSNYVSQVNPDNCVACGECVEVCPTNALKLGKKLCSTEPDKIEKIDLPNDMDWPEEKWNPDYRTNRKVVLDGGSSPCKAECPAHIGVQGYLKLAAQGRYTEALELIKTENPFPAVCGRICPRKCESECTRGDIDDPVAIDDIKKFIAEKDLHAETRYIPAQRHNYSDKKIAVIGAGPAGLSCAYYLALDGYSVTVFEKEEILGGMLTLGIPSYRLEKDVIHAEIDVLRELGVEFKTGIEVGKDISLDELRNQDYKAFYLAIGAQAGRKIGLEGEDAEGLVTGVDFLRRVNLGEDLRLSGKVLVIGGGNVAIDVARTAAKLGPSQVDLFCLEARAQMPALEEEIEEALGEDIKINNSWGPVRVLTENGKVRGLELKKCLSVFDEDGRFNPQFDDSETRIVEADHVLLSVGQAIEWGDLLRGSDVKLNRNNTVIVDETSFQTGAPDIFAGGDAVTGPKFAIDAIALGKEGAISIHRFVQKGQSLVYGRIKRDYKAFNKNSLILDGYDQMPRQRVPHVDGKRSKESFRDLRETFTEEQVKKETERCLGCGVTVVQEEMCVGCGACTTKCKFEGISLVRKYDAQAVEFEDLKPTVMKHAIKRKIRITAKKPVKKVQSLFSKQDK